MKPSPSKKPVKKPVKKNTRSASASLKVTKVICANCKRPIGKGKGCCPWEGVVCREEGPLKRQRDAAAALPQATMRMPPVSTTHCTRCGKPLVGKGACTWHGGVGKPCKQILPVISDTKGFALISGAQAKGIRDLMLVIETWRLRHILQKTSGLETKEERDLDMAFVQATILRIPEAVTEGGNRSMPIDNGCMNCIAFTDQEGKAMLACPTCKVMAHV